jgi:magnesium chelatase family protein
VYFVPRPNLREARSFGSGEVYAAGSLKEAAESLRRLASGEAVPESLCAAVEESPSGLSFDDITGQDFLKRAVEVAAAGRHNLLLFGPPGAGKTMAATRLPSVLPPLSRGEALEVTRIHSLAGLLPADSGLVTRRPFRCPHHGASLEGLTGGGKLLLPGEVSLAHCGVLFLDEAAEFQRGALQALREPMESQRIAVARAGQRSWYPCDFQLVLAANPCPCGNLGREDKVCMCGRDELFRYWRRLGGALLDRVDIRFPLAPLGADIIAGAQEMKDSEMRERIEKAVALQTRRAGGAWNARLVPANLKTFCALSPENEELLKSAARKLGLSGRAVASILKVARTIADLAGENLIGKEDILEAIQYRRYGDGDYMWSND